MLYIITNLCILYIYIYVYIKVYTMCIKCTVYVQVRRVQFVPSAAHSYTTASGPCDLGKDRRVDSVQ